MTRDTWRELRLVHVRQDRLYGLAGAARQASEGDARAQQLYEIATRKIFLVHEAEISLQRLATFLVHRRITDDSQCRSSLTAGDTLWPKQVPTLPDRAWVPNPSSLLRRLDGRNAPVRGDTEGTTPSSAARPDALVASSRRGHDTTRSRFLSWYARRD